jgi:hypothetical protein
MDAKDDEGLTNDRLALDIASCNEILKRLFLRFNRGLARLVVIVRRGSLFDLCVSRLKCLKKSKA